MKNISKDHLIPELVIIGMHNAYMGYEFLEGSDIIQSFYVDEYAKKEIFKEWLSLYTPLPFTENQWRNVPEFKELRSKEIVDALTSSKYFKDKAYTGGSTMDGTKFFTMRPLESRELNTEEKMSLLYGIFLRWGKITENNLYFSFGNNGEKVGFLRDLLYTFPYVTSITQKTQATVPTFNEVWIPSNELCEMFTLWSQNDDVLA